MNLQFVELIFWILILLIIYVYLGYPFLLMILSKTIKKEIVKDKSEPLPSVTIFIPVFNEELIIGRKLENSLSLDYPPHLLEVAVASDGSEDETNEILKRYRKKGVKVFINSQNEGKNVVINKFIPFTKGDIIVFTDANSIFSKDALRNIIKNFSDPQVGCVGGKLKYLKGESSVSKGEGLYFRYENIIRKLEGLQGNMVGANGAIYAIRRELFDPIPSHVPNDFFHPLSILKRDFYVVFEEKAVAFEKPSEDQREEFNRRARIVARSFGALIEINRIYGVFKGRGWFNIVSHKILRWFAFPIMLTALSVNLFLLESPIYLFTLFLQAMFYGFGIVGCLLNALGNKSKLFYIPYYFLLINIAGIIGLYNYLRGEKIVTWKAASTTR